jgi:hypothetical protein
MPQKPCSAAAQISHAGVVMKVASVGPGSISTTLSMMPRAPSSSYQRLELFVREQPHVAAGDDRDHRLAL